jgi:hypothetical protein
MVNQVNTKKKGKKKLSNSLQRQRHHHRVNAIMASSPPVVLNGAPNTPSHMYERQKSDPSMEKEWRIMIAGCFRQTLKMPAKENSFGTGGTIDNIMDVFQLYRETQGRVERVLEYGVAHKDRGEVYPGERLKGQGAPHMVSKDFAL